MKKLGLGIQSIKELLEQNYLYVDKTEHIYHLITSGKYYFLSRPRSFGNYYWYQHWRKYFQATKRFLKIAGFMIKSSGRHFQ